MWTVAAIVYIVHYYTVSIVMVYFCVAMHVIHCIQAYRHEYDQVFTKM